MSRSTALLLTVAMLAAAAVVTGCGNSTKTISQTEANGQVTRKTAAAVHFARRKFVLHVGLAFGTLHRYVYKPLKSGAFEPGAAGRAKAFITAAGAALFAAHELRIARTEALSDEHLRPLAEKIESLTGRIGGLVSAFKGGSLKPAEIATAAGEASALGSASSGVGATIKEVAPSL